MPWYKVPLAAHVLADDPEEARARALELLPDDPSGPLGYAGCPVELTQGQVEDHLRLREILDQAKADSDAGLMVSDPRRPGVRFTPGAAAALAALEFEEQQEI